MSVSPADGIILASIGFMSRRRFLKAGAALAAGALPWSRLARAASAPAVPLTRLGVAAPFDYAQLKGMARSMAAVAYKPPNAALPAPIAKLGWDQWQAIRFRDDHSLWAGDGVWFQARFFHLGFTVTKPVRLYSVENGRAQELAYDPAMFDYSRSGVMVASCRRTSVLRDSGSISHRLGARRGRVPGRLVLSRGRRRQAVRHVAARARDRFRHAAAGGVPGVHRLLSRASGQGFEPCHRLRPARLAERRGRVPIRHRCRRHASSWTSMRRCTRARPSSGSASHRHQHVPRPAPNDRRIAYDWRPRYTIPTGCRSGPGPANGSGGRW